MPRISVADMMAELDKATAGDPLERIAIKVRGPRGETFDIGKVSVATFRDGAEVNHELWLAPE